MSGLGSAWTSRTATTICPCDVFILDPIHPRHSLKPRLLSLSQSCSILISPCSACLWLSDQKESNNHQKEGSPPPNQKFVTLKKKKVGNIFIFQCFLYLILRLFGLNSLLDRTNLNNLHKLSINEGGNASLSLNLLAVQLYCTETTAAVSLHGNELKYEKFRHICSY